MIQSEIETPMYVKDQWLIRSRIDPMCWRIPTVNELRTIVNDSWREINETSK